MSSVNYTHSSGSSFSDRAASSLGHLLDFAKHIRKRISDRRELNYLLSLSEYQLKDIGLQRGEIQREANKSIWRL